MKNLTSSCLIRVFLRIEAQACGSQRMESNKAIVGIYIGLTTSSAIIAAGGSPDVAVLAKEGLLGIRSCRE